MTPREKVVQVILMHREVIPESGGLVLGPTEIVRAMQDFAERRLLQCGPDLDAGSSRDSQRDSL